MLTGKQKVEQLNEIKISHKEELKQFDMSLVLQLDQKVSNDLSSYNTVMSRSVYIDYVMVTAGLKRCFLGDRPAANSRARRSSRILCNHEFHGYQSADALAGFYIKVEQNANAELGSIEGAIYLKLTVCDILYFHKINLLSNMG